MALRDLPVLDPDRTPKHRMVMERDVATDVDVFGRAKAFVDFHATAFHLKAQRLRHVEVWLDAHRDEDQVDLVPAPV